MARGARQDLNHVVEVPEDEWTALASRVAASSARPRPPKHAAEHVPLVLRSPAQRAWPLSPLCALPADPDPWRPSYAAAHGLPPAAPGSAALCNVRRLWPSARATSHQMPRRPPSQPPPGETSHVSYHQGPHVRAGRRSRPSSSALPSPGRTRRGVHCACDVVAIAIEQLWAAARLPGPRRSIQTAGA